MQKILFLSFNLLMKFKHKYILWLIIFFLCRKPIELAKSDEIKALFQNT